MKNKEVLIKPSITEKSMRLLEEGYYMFNVGLKSNKKEIASQVHELFGVDVVEVRSLIRRGKTKKLVRQRKTVTTAPKKFALIKLSEGQKIAGFEKELEVENNGD